MRHRYFRSNMDRNYANKHAAACAGIPGATLTVADVSKSAPHGIDPAAHDLLMIGVFASNPDPTDPPESGVPLRWSQQIPKRCATVEDMRHTDDISDFMTRHGCQYLIATYQCAELDALLAKCKTVQRVFLIPHHIDTRLYRRLAIPKVNDVLLYGSTHPRYYPFRLRLANLLRASPFRVHIVDYPGRNSFDPTRCGEPLVTLINQSWLSIATPTTSDYLVAKYFEIAACGSVIAGPIPAQGLPIFGDCSVPLHPAMSDAEILLIIGDALADKETLRSKAALAHNCVHRDYSLERYVERLSAAIAEMAASR